MYPSSSQEAALLDMLGMHQRLHNAALELNGFHVKSRPTIESGALGAKRSSGQLSQT
jgi:hypothetical protein